jgi:proteic killer suppression protein
VIKGIRDKLTLAVYQGILPKGFPQDAYKSARKKLAILDAATTLAETNIPPGNRLEALTGDRVGQHSIRINRQWRICFVWKEDGCHDVEIKDYH